MRTTLLLSTRGEYPPSPEGGFLLDERGLPQFRQYFLLSSYSIWHLWQNITFSRMSLVFHGVVLLWQIIEDAFYVPGRINYEGFDFEVLCIIEWEQTDAEWKKFKRWPKLCTLGNKWKEESRSNDGCASADLSSKTNFGIFFLSLYLLAISKKDESLLCSNKMISIYKLFQDLRMPIP